MKEKTRQFIFLYPIKEYFDVEISKDASLYLYSKGLAENYLDRIKEYNKAKTKEEQLSLEQKIRDKDCERFRPEYFRIINFCIDKRYREKGFKINFAVFDDTPVDGSVKVLDSDNVIKVGITRNQHFHQKIYPSQDKILNQLPPKIEHLRIAGFHAWDCVEKLAKRAYERGIDVLIDEDLTQFLVARIVQDENFKFDSYPGYHPKECFKGCGGFDGFMMCRKGKPWFIQNY